MANSPHDIWQNCLALIKEKVSPDSFNTWFRPVKPVKFEEDILTIEVPSQFFYEYLEEHFLSLLKSTIRDRIGKTARLEYLIVVENGFNNNGIPTTVKMPGNSSDSGFKHNSMSPPIHHNKDLPNPFVLPGIKDFELESNLTATYTFDNFVEGNFNRVARSAGYAVANKPGTTAYNPLFIFGATGLGKTHLLQAIGNHIQKQTPNKRVMYITSERFFSHFMDSARVGNIGDFMQLYQMVDALLIDDIQFFANKEKTQETFFHIFNQLTQGGRQIVLASDRPAQELQGIEERLISRFKGGLSASMEIPDYETRMAILRNKMYQNGIVMTPDVVEFLANHITSNIRELEGALISLLAQSSLNRRQIDIELASELVYNFVERLSKEVSIESIQKAVARHFEVDLAALKASSRKRDIVQARQLAMYFAKELTQESLKSIGAAFGGRDHTTVMHSLDAVENRVATDRDFSQEVSFLREKLAEEFGLNSKI